MAHKRRLTVAALWTLAVSLSVVATEVGLQPAFSVPSDGSILRRVRQRPGAWHENVATDSSREMLAIPEEANVPDGVPFIVAKEPPVVDFVIYPEMVNPFGEKPPRVFRVWSQWGKGCVTEDGAYFSAVGDHGGPDGETIIYEYDPGLKRIRRAVSFMRLMGHRRGEWGYGKIHGRLDQGEDGWIYFAGFWGNWPESEGQLDERYDGGVVARYNPETHMAEHFGSPVHGISWCITGLDRKRMLMYMLGEDQSVVCFDVRERRLLYLGSEDIQFGGRGLIVDEVGGVAYFGAKSEQGARLAHLDPTTGTVTLTAAFVPGNSWLRAETDHRAADGNFYCMTHAGAVPTGTLFRFDPETEEIENLGPGFGAGAYTTSIALSPGGRYIYYVPGAYDSWKYGGPVLQYDIEKRQRKVVAFLGPYYHERYGYRVGGTFGVSISRDGSTLFISMNGGAHGGVQGEPSIFAVHVPESERGE